MCAMPPQTLSLTHERERSRVGPFAVHGTSFVIESNEPSMAADLDARLRDLRVEIADGSPIVYTVDRHGPPWASHPWGVWRDGEPCETTLIPTYVVDYLLWEITRLLLENVAPHVPIISGAVTLDGRAMVLAGPAQAGKATLTTWLATRGWGFLTDEVATLDLSGDCPVFQPFWRPVGIRRGGPLESVVPADDTDDPAVVPASTIGSLSSAAPLSAVVLPAYSPGHAHDLEPLTPAQTLAGLTEHLPLMGQPGRQSFAGLARVAEAVPGYSLRVDDLDEAEERLRALVRGLT